MNKYVEDLYYSLPPVVQNIFVSGYGYFLCRKRYGGNFRSILRELEELRYKNIETVNKITNERLQAVVQYSAREIPYYSELFKKVGVDPRSIKSPSDLKYLPVLEKETIRRIPDQFSPKNKKSRNSITQTTSGSTGTPLKVHVDQNTYKTAMALLAEHEMANGVGLGDRRATFAGRMVQRIDSIKPPFWRYNYAEKQMIFSAYHLNSQTAGAYVNKLNAFQPKELIGYPSAIHALARYIQDQSLDLKFTPTLIVTNSETLFSWQRETLESVFKCTVADYYGSAEYVSFGSQCNSSNYHMNPLIGVVEIAKKGVPVEIGQVGDLLCTTSSNFSMPLIRYRVGDLGARGGQGCSCGCSYPFISRIEGRADDLVITTDGRKIGRLDHIFKGLSTIKEGQIIQQTKKEVILQLVVDEDYEKNNEKSLYDNLTARIGSDIDISFKYVSSIPRTSGGKFKGVISHVKYDEG